MANNELYIQNGSGTILSSNSSNQTIAVNIDPEQLCTSVPSSSIFISYGTSDPDANTTGKIYIKYKN